jgi:hypothetical protein
MFVPSLSWQNYCFDIKMAQKWRFLFLLYRSYARHSSNRRRQSSHPAEKEEKKKRRRRREEEESDKTFQKCNEMSTERKAPAIKRAAKNKLRKEKKRKEKKRKEKKDRKSSVGRARAPTYLPAWVPDVRLRHDVIPDQPV